MVQSLNGAGPNHPSWQGWRLLQKETSAFYQHIWQKRLNHNIAVFAVSVSNMLTDKTALFYPEEERNRDGTIPRPQSAVLNCVQ